MRNDKSTVVECPHEHVRLFTRLQTSPYPAIEAGKVFYVFGFRKRNGLVWNVPKETDVCEVSSEREMLFGCPGPTELLTNVSNKFLGCSYTSKDHPEML